MSTPPFPQPPPSTPASDAHPSNPYAVHPDPAAAVPPGPGHPTGGGAALGWAIGAAVAAGIALVLSVLALLLAGSGAFSGAVLDEELGEGPDEGWAESVRGQVGGLPDGAPLSGDRLEWAVDVAERESGWTIEDLSCPDTAAVSTSTVVVCTGTYEDGDWTGAVLFEDSVGGFVVAEF